MRTFEAVTTQASTDDIDQALKSSNNTGASWFVNAPAQAGTAKLVVVTKLGVEFVVQSDSIGTGAPTLIVYDFAIPANAIFRWTPGGTTSSVLTSLLTVRPAR